MGLSASEDEMDLDSPLSPDPMEGRSSLPGWTPHAPTVGRKGRGGSYVWTRAMKQQLLVLYIIYSRDPLKPSNRAQVLKELKEMLDARPNMPFSIKMSDGQEVPLKDLATPDHMARLLFGGGKMVGLLSYLRSWVSWGGKNIHKKASLNEIVSLVPENS